MLPVTPLQQSECWSTRWTRAPGRSLAMVCADLQRAVSELRRLRRLLTVISERSVAATLRQGIEKWEFVAAELRRELASLRAPAFDSSNVSDSDEEDAVDDGFTPPFPQQQSIQEEEASTGRGGAPQSPVTGNRQSPLKQLDAEQLRQLADQQDATSPTKQHAARSSAIAMQGTEAHSPTTTSPAFPRAASSVSAQSSIGGSSPQQKHSRIGSAPRLAGSSPPGGRKTSTSPATSPTGRNGGLRMRRTASLVQADADLRMMGVRHPLQLVRELPLLVVRKLKVMIRRGKERLQLRVADTQYASMLRRRVGQRLLAELRVHLQAADLRTAWRLRKHFGRWHRSVEKILMYQESAGVKLRCVVRNVRLRRVFAAWRYFSAMCGVVLRRPSGIRMLDTVVRHASSTSDELSSDANQPIAISSPIVNLVHVALTVLMQAWRSTRGTLQEHCVPCSYGMVMNDADDAVVWNVFQTCMTDRLDTMVRRVYLVKAFYGWKRIFLVERRIRRSRRMAADAFHIRMTSEGVFGWWKHRVVLRCLWRQKYSFNMGMCFRGWRCFTQRRNLERRSSRAFIEGTDRRLRARLFEKWHRVTPDEQRREELEAQCVATIQKGLRRVSRLALFSIFTRYLLVTEVESMLEQTRKRSHPPCGRPSSPSAAVSGLMTAQEVLGDEVKRLAFLSSGASLDAQWLQATCVHIVAFMRWRLLRTHAILVRGLTTSATGFDDIAAIADPNDPATAGLRRASSSRKGLSGGVGAASALQSTFRSIRRPPDQRTSSSLHYAASTSSSATRGPVSHAAAVGAWSILGMVVSRLLRGDVLDGVSNDLEPGSPPYKASVSPVSSCLDVSVQHVASSKRPLERALSSHSQETCASVAQKEPRGSGDSGPAAARAPQLLRITNVSQVEALFHVAELVAAPLVANFWYLVSADYDECLARRVVTPRVLQRCAGDEAAFQDVCMWVHQVFCRPATSSAPLVAAVDDADGVLHRYMVMGGEWRRESLGRRLDDIRRSLTLPFAVMLNASRSETPPDDADEVSTVRELLTAAVVCARLRNVGANLHDRGQSPTSNAASSGEVSPFGSPTLVTHEAEIAFPSSPPLSLPPPLFGETPASQVRLPTAGEVLMGKRARELRAISALTCRMAAAAYANPNDDASTSVLGFLPSEVNASFYDLFVKRRRKKKQKKVASSAASALNGKDLVASSDANGEFSSAVLGLPGGVSGAGVPHNNNNRRASLDLRPAGVSMAAHSRTQQQSTKQHNPTAEIPTFLGEHVIAVSVDPIRDADNKKVTVVSPVLDAQSSSVALPSSLDAPPLEDMRLSSVSPLSFVDVDDLGTDQTASAGRAASAIPELLPDVLVPCEDAAQDASFVTPENQSISLDPVSVQKALEDAARRALIADRTPVNTTLQHEMDLCLPAAQLADLSAPVSSPIPSPLSQPATCWSTLETVPDTPKVTNAATTLAAHADLPSLQRSSIGDACNRCERKLPDIAEDDDDIDALLMRAQLPQGTVRSLQLFAWERSQEQKSSVPSHRQQHTEIVSSVDAPEVFSSLSAPPVASRTAPSVRENRVSIDHLVVDPRRRHPQHGEPAAVVYSTLYGAPSATVSFSQCPSAERPSHEVVGLAGRALRRRR